MHSIDADATVTALDEIIASRGRHPCLGSPWQNPWVESYGSRMRDELLAIEQFDSLLEAQVLVADWRSEYNGYRPHSALGMLTRPKFARRWRNQPQLL